METTNHRGSALGRLLLTGVALLGLAACEEGVTAPEPATVAQLGVARTLVQVESLDETFEVQPRAYTVDGEVVPGAPLLWSVEGEDVIERTGESSFRSRANGRATIRVRLDPAAASVSGAPLEVTVHVVVRQRPVALELASATGTGPGEPTVRLGALGQTVRIDVRAVDALGNPLPETPTGIAWSIGDPAVTRLEDGGTVRAMADGTTVLRGWASGLEGEVTIDVDATLDLSACASVPAAGSDADACADGSLTVQVGG